jgi:hypothetical protein
MLQSRPIFLLTEALLSERQGCHLSICLEYFAPTASWVESIQQQVGNKIPTAIRSLTPSSNAAEQTDLLPTEALPVGATRLPSINLPRILAPTASWVESIQQQVGNKIPTAIRSLTPSSNAAEQTDLFADGSTPVGATRLPSINLPRILAPTASWVESIQQQVGNKIPTAIRSLTPSSNAAEQTDLFAESSSETQIPPTSLINRLKSIKLNGLICAFIEHYGYRCKCSFRHTYRFNVSTVRFF